jgi:diaminopimelate decarboxylase
MPPAADPPAILPFRAEGGELTCDGVRLTEVASAVGTPAYVYSAAAIRSAYRRLDQALASVPHAIHYALKANSALAVLRLLRGLGSGADANSVGEIEVALRAGFAPGDIVFTGVGKTAPELARAVSLGVKAINVESPGELARLDAIAAAKGVRARVAIRVNPDIAAETHPKISTGLRATKFGVAIEQARELYRTMASSAGLQPVGIHVHVGSQILTLGPLIRASEMVASLARQLREDGIALEHVDLGGGLGIAYDGGVAPTAAEYAAAVLPPLVGTGLALLVEPGRVIVGPAGVLLARVVDVKRYPGGERFAVLDTGMTELLRPALYGALHRIEPVLPRQGVSEPCEIVGPLCETSDTFGPSRRMPPLEVGDLLAIRDTGAYGSVMASTYNRRTTPPEVLVDDGRWRVVRRRQTIDDMLSLEQ